MLLDTERRIYLAFGLPRSVAKVWGVGSMVYYAEKITQGIPLPKPYENIHDDAIQMGGDFVINKNGDVTFMYCSQTSSDRPLISAVLEAIKGCDK